MKDAKEKGIPLRSRAILREYLQVKTLDFLYSQKESSKLAFIGGTSLRLMRDLPRFSEDLDFDNLGVKDAKMIMMMEKVKERFEAENIPVELFQKITEGKTYFELRFPSLLMELSISTNPREKLMIKVDYSRTWHGQKTETALLNRLGVIQQVVVNTLDQTLVEKLGAYVGRKSIQPRDMYDTVWLVGQGAKLDLEFMKVNKIGDLMTRVLERWEREGVTGEMKRKLAPFLFVPGDEAKLDLFKQVLDKL
jgi:predicted nucleotidyltransferase component of viral defense system